MIPVIIGQAPSRLSDPAEPLSGTSGRRLASLCGLSHDEFLVTFERRNLLDVWPGRSEGTKGDLFVGLAEARRIAERVSPALVGRPVVLLGVSVAAAFVVTAPAFLWVPHRGFAAAWSPHPSGVNTWWNDPANEARARDFWGTLARGSRSLRAIDLAHHPELVRRSPAS